MEITYYPFNYFRYFSPHILTFVWPCLQVHNAGHMVPMDQPKNSLEMLFRWTRGKSLGGKVADPSIIKKITMKEAADKTSST